MTFTPTMDAGKAKADGDNSIITHRAQLLQSPRRSNFCSPAIRSIGEKMAYIHEHHLVIFRWHDGWHLYRKLDEPLRVGVRRLAGSRSGKPGEQFFTLPQTTLDTWRKHPRTNTPVSQPPPSEILTERDERCFAFLAHREKKSRSVLSERNDVDVLAPVSRLERHRRTRPRPPRPRDA